MFKQPKNQRYMEALDLWTDANVIGPIYQAADEYLATDNEQPYRAAIVSVKKAIRQKMLESYHNGKEAGRGKGAQR